MDHYIQSIIYEGYKDSVFHISVPQLSQLVHKIKMLNGGAVIVNMIYCPHFQLPRGLSMSCPGKDRSSDTFA